MPAANESNNERTVHTPKVAQIFAWTGNPYRQMVLLGEKPGVSSNGAPQVYQDRGLPSGEVLISNLNLGLNAHKTVLVTQMNRFGNDAPAAVCSYYKPTAMPPPGRCDFHASLVLGKAGHS